MYFSQRLIEKFFYYSSLLSVQPCYMKDWELHVHFKIHGKGSDLYGDGFAVWFTKDRMELGSVLCNMWMNLS